MMLNLKRLAYPLLLSGTLLLGSCGRAPIHKANTYPVYSSSELRIDQAQISTFKNDFKNLQSDFKDRYQKKLIIPQKLLEELNLKAQSYESFLGHFLQKYQGLYKLDDPKSEQLYQLENESMLKEDLIESQKQFSWNSTFLNDASFRKSHGYTITEDLYFLSDYAFMSREKIKESLKKEKANKLLSKFKTLNPNTNPNRNFSNLIFGENRKIEDLTFKLSSLLNEDTLNLSITALIDSETEAREQRLSLLNLNQELENRIRTEVPALRNMNFFVSEVNFNLFENESFESNKEFIYYIILGLEPLDAQGDQAAVIFPLESLVFEGKKSLDKSSLKPLFLKNF
jgi:hypothetical protein